MKIHYLLSAAAAAALISGAAQAQDIKAAPDPAADAMVKNSGAVNPPVAVPNTAAPAVDAGMRSSAMPAAPAADSSMSSPAATGAATDTSTTTTTDASGATLTASTTTNGPIPDTAENRAKYGQPLSHAGKHSKASGN